MKAYALPKTFKKSILDKWLGPKGPGLCHGAGDGKKSVCVEQAVALCLGIELTDHPNGCIAPAIPAFCRRLNDCNWSNDKARAAGMRQLAYEQLGSMGIDEKWFASRIAELTIRELLPPLFRLVAEKQPEPHKTKMIEAADRCEKYGDKAAANAANAAANAANDAYAANAAAYAANAAANAAYAADAAAYAANAANAAYAADAAYAAYAAAYVANAAAFAANAADDKFLLLIAKIGLKAIREAKERARIPLFKELVKTKKG